MARVRGFTLIELVLVMVLIGILAAFAIPRWLERGGFELYTLRDELLARLRLVQTMNLHEPSDRCTRLVLEKNGFGHLTQLRQGKVCPAAGPISGWSPVQRERGGVVASDSGVQLTPTTITFDKLGRPLGNCAGGCLITLGRGGESLAIRIEAEGYIHNG